MLKSLKQIDRFYYFLGGVLTVLAVVAIVILKTIFSAFETASQIDEENLKSPIPRVEKAKLEEVYGKLYDRRPPQLDL
jgi:hypothetical protein